MSITRIEGLAKVTGAKIYGRDYRAHDVEDWPQRTLTVRFLRAQYADRRFEGLQLDRVPGGFEPKVVIDGERLERDKINITNDGRPALRGSGRYLIVPAGEKPEFLGHPIALLVFESAEKERRFSHWLQENPAFIQYEPVAADIGEQDVRRLLDPLLAAVQREPENFYGSQHYMRIAGEPDVFSHAQEPYHNPWDIGPVPKDSRRRLERNQAARDTYDRIERNILDQGWTVLDRTFATSTNDPMFMEPEAGLAWLNRDNLRLELLLGTQSPGGDIRNIERMVGNDDCPFKDYEVGLTACYPGGGFGGRDASTFPHYLALAALYSDSPVRIALDRFEQFLAGIKRHASAIRNRLAYDAEGNLQALVSNVIMDGGGESNLTMPVVGLAALHAAGPYRIPLTAISSSGLVTKASPSGSMRGFGIPQVSFAIESMIDEVAERLGQDPIEFRLDRVLTAGEKDVTGNVLEHHLANRELCQLALDHPLWARREQEKQDRDGRNIAYGVGFGCCMEAYGTSRDAVYSEVGFEPDGRLTIHSPAVDMGQGAATGLAIASTKLGRHAESISMGRSRFFDVMKLHSRGDRDDTWTPKISNSMSASVSAFHHIQAVEEACQVIWDHGIVPATRRLLGDDVTEMSWQDGDLVAGGNTRLTIRQLVDEIRRAGLVRRAMVHSYYQVRYSYADYTLGGATHRRYLDALAVVQGDGDDYQTITRKNVQYPNSSMRRYRRSLYASVGHLIGVEVHRYTGRIKVVAAVTFLDAGEVHNLDLLSGQIEGGLAKGIGMSLLEELPSAPGGADGRWNLHRYQVVRARHMPLDHMEQVLIPLEGQILEDGPPLRKKGIAEAAMSTVAPAVANAVAHAVGVRINTLPMTPVRVLEALKQSGH